jgi:hypothetical protein
MGEQYVYLIRLIKDDYTQPHIKVFLDKDLAMEYFENDLKFYRKTNWSVDDSKNEYGSGALRRGYMTKRNEEGQYEHMSLLLERYGIIKK